MIFIKIGYFLPDHVVVYLKSAEPLLDELEFNGKEAAKVHHLVEFTSVCLFLESVEQTVMALSQFFR